MTPARSWLTLRQAADTTGRTRRTIQRWVTDQRLTTVTIDGTRYVNELAVLHLERDTRRARHQPRPPTPALPPLDMTVVRSRHGGQCPAHRPD